MTLFVATKIDLNTSKPSCYIQFNIEPGRQSIHYDLFKTKYYRNNREFYSFSFLDDFVIRYKNDERFYNKNTNIINPEYPIEEIPIITVPSLWKFFKLIGFDYKTKTWI